MWLLLVAVAAVGSVPAAEAAVRAVVRTRAEALMSAIVVAHAPVEVTLPTGSLLAQVLRGRIDHLVITCRRIGLAGPEAEVLLEAVEVDLREVGVSPTGQVRDGHGVLRGRMPAEEVLRRAGVRGDLVLRDGSVTVHWPARRSRVPSLGLRVRPVVDGARIRLAPTPLLMSLPPLPPGAVIRTVDARDDALVVVVDLTLARLLNPPAS